MENTISPGGWDIASLNTKIQRQLQINGDYTSSATGNTFLINISV